MKELYAHLKETDTEQIITDFCAKQGIQSNFILEHAPHFGGLWEAAVKSFKRHFCHVMRDVRVSFEELTTVLTQIESCLNSRPLTSLPQPEDDIEALSPGNFLIGGPKEALPGPPQSFHKLSLLRRWHLCQTLVQHLWKRWSTEYLTSLQRLLKRNRPSSNLQAGDVIWVQGEISSPAKWPLARIEAVHPGKDGKVRVVTIGTTKGIYKCPIAKIAPLHHQHANC